MVAAARTKLGVAEQPPGSNDSPEIKTFRDSFVPSNKEDVPVGSAEESGDDAQDSEQVQIVKQKR